MWTLVVALLFSLKLADADASPPTADGYIRVVQDNSVWWFQDGDGRKFFSLGVNCIGGCFGHAEDAPLSPSRKVRIMALLKDWGMNTAGAWSSPSVWDELYVADQIYTGFLPDRHDVFDEGFWTGEYAEHLKHEVMPFLGKKQFIGYFLDNEPEWNARPIWAFYLRLSQERPGSQAFVRYLKTYYRGSIGQLNRAWRTSYVSFDAIPGSHPRPRGAFPGEWAVMQAWRTEVAATYYRRYAAMVRALDPQHLILGIRYRGVPDMELFKALAPYFDVNSINDYNRYGHLRPVYAELYKVSGKPLLITEFSFSGFPEPGQQSCLFIDVYTHERRGMGYHKYVLQAARAPFMVGMHWFMWMDYGRPDDAPAGYPYPPEQNVGLLSHDERVVYEEFASWVTRANAEVEAAHRAARRAPRPAPQHRVLHRFTPTVDGALAEWPKALAIKPNHVDSLVDGVQANHTYFLSWDQEAVYLAGDISDAQLLHPQTEKDCWWAADYLALDVAAVKPSGALERSSALFLMYPLGTGAGGQQPYVAQWEGARGLQPVATQVAKRLRPGGYTIEARIPVTAMKGVKGGPGPCGTSSCATRTSRRSPRPTGRGWRGFGRETGEPTVTDAESDVAFS